MIFWKVINIEERIILMKKLFKRFVMLIIIFNLEN